MKNAKAAVMTGVNEPFKVREFPLTPAPEGMAGIKLTASGICGTDIHIHRGKIPVNTPTIIGHEFVGVVDDISESDSKKYNISPGDNVIVDIACPCGKCLLCSHGDDANCVNMGVTNGGNPEIAPHLYGGYAEYNYSPVKNLIKIPAKLNPKMVSVFACAGPTAFHAFHLAAHSRCGIEDAKVAVVQGLGPVGMFAMIYLAALGIPNVIAITSRNNKKRNELAAKFGATETYSLTENGEEEIQKRVKELSGGLGADVVFEGSGNPNAVPFGLELLRNRGTYLIPGQYSNSGKVEIAPQMITFNALQIIGSSQYSVTDVEAYINFLEKNPQLHDIILSLATEYKVSDINMAIDDVKAGRNIKTILVP